MRQNGHVTEFTGRYSQTRADYDRTPVKPVLDGEPIYEDHPVSFDAAKLGHSVAADVRRPLYWDLFGGAFGHTYGHHSVWQMWAPGRQPVNNPLMPWFEADRPAGRGPDAVRPTPDRVAPVPHAHPGRHGHSARRREDRGARRPAVTASRPRATPRGASRWCTHRSGVNSRCAWTR